MQEVNVYNLEVGNECVWEHQIKDKNDYPVDLSSKVITARIVPFTDSIYEYTLAHTVVNASQGLLRFTLPVSISSELLHFIHTYYVYLDGVLTFYGTLRPSQEYHNQLAESSNRI